MGEREVASRHALRGSGNLLPPFDLRAVGGFRDLPVCDDVDLVRRLRKSGAFVVRPEKTVTSPRRYREVGTLRQVLRTWRVLAGYYAGVPPETLSRWYEGR